MVVKPKDRFLAHGGSGKLRSYWEKTIYVVKEQVADNPVYIPSPESRNKKGTRNLHCNLLLLVNDLPVETLPHPKEPAKQRPSRQSNKGTKDIDRFGRGQLWSSASWTGQRREDTYVGPGESSCLKSYTSTTEKERPWMESQTPNELISDPIPPSGGDKEKSTGSRKPG